MTEEAQLISIRQMQIDDIDPIVGIIECHDEDDGEEALRTYREDGVAGHYVALLDDQLIGVSGAIELADCDRSFQLSWTYMDKSFCNRGYGRQLVQHVLDELRRYNARKVFIYVSDYKDEDGVEIYAGAMHLYLSLDFTLELKIENYYDLGESLSVLGLMLEDQQFDSLPVKPESPKVKFNNLIHIAETESAYSFGWSPKRFGKTFTSRDIEIGLDAAQNEGASLVLISFPSNYDNIEQPVLNVGFQVAGQLKDYYENGVDENHYIFSFIPVANENARLPGKI